MGTESSWCHSVKTLRTKSGHLPQFLLGDQMIGIVEQHCSVVTHKGPLCPVFLRKWAPLRINIRMGEKPASVSINKSRHHFVASLLGSSHREHPRYPNSHTISFNWDGSLSFRGRNEHMPWNQTGILRTNWGNTEEILHLALVQLTVPG